MKKYFKLYDILIWSTMKVSDEPINGLDAIIKTFGKWFLLNLLFVTFFIHLYLQSVMSKYVGQKTCTRIQYLLDQIAR